MVDDRITDGKRIAQLLSSELAGLETGPLAAVAIVDAEPDLEPTADGTLAYRISHDDAVVGHVCCYPDRAVLAGLDWAAVPESNPLEHGPDGLVLADAVAVKHAVDVVRACLASRDGPADSAHE